MFCYPQVRLRRLRTSGWIRTVCAETCLNVSDLIMPVCIHDDSGTYEPLEGLEGLRRYSSVGAIELARQAFDLGIKAVVLFCSVRSDLKNGDATEAYNPDSFFVKAISEIKRVVPNLGIFADVALDPYTSHGHDGIVKDGKIDNDLTLDVLCKQALVLASAGVDVIAPSDMMDGRVGVIRRFIDASGFTDVAIMSYAAKYSSAFYEPFRSAFSLGNKVAVKLDKRTYHMNPANIMEAVREVELDVREGADMIMIKPGTMYLDVVHSICSKFTIPVFSYHVSGEYAMLKAASKLGWLNYESGLYEVLMSIKRAGASGIFTYAALEVAKNPKVFLKEM